MNQNTGEENTAAISVQQSSVSIRHVPDPLLPSPSPDPGLRVGCMQKVQDKVRELRESAAARRSGIIYRAIKLDWAGSRVSQFQH